MESEFSPRLKQILLIMLREDRTLSVKYLSEQMNVSKRTVQRELEYLDKPLRRYGLTFCSKTGTGVWLDGEPEKKERLREALEEEPHFDSSDRGERRKRLILEILKDKTLKKLYYYSDLFGVSEATVSADLEAVESWFLPFQLKILRRPGYGISIEGKEEDFRRALRSFIDENIDTKLIREIYEEKNQALFELVDNKNEKNIYRILNDNLLLRVIACIQRVNDRRILNLTENSYVGLVLHVTIAVDRILKQEVLEDNEMMVASLRGDDDFRLAGEIVAELAREFEVSIPEIEAAYVCLHIKGAKVQQITLDDDSLAKVSEERELLQVVDEMIDRYDREVAYQLKQDEEFVVQGLAAHLKPTLVRLANKMKIENPLLEQIKNDYPEVYERCVDVARVIEEHYGYPVPEPEIGYLAIHFGAAMVRLESRKEVKRQVEVGVVCASGIGISRLMASKISKAFMDRVCLTAYGLSDLTPFVLEKTDFFVSTLPIKESADILFVSPLLTQRDMEEMAARVRKYERMPAEKEKDDTFTRQLEQINLIAAQIKNLIKGVRLIKVDNTISFDELLVALSEEQSPYAGRRQAIIEALKRRERLGSQLFPDFSFALLHARTSGVIRPSFAACVPKDRGVFTSEKLSGIRVAILMLVPEDENVRENTDILGFLSEKLVEDETFLRTLMEKEEEEIRAQVSRYLKQYFSQFLDRV